MNSLIKLHQKQGLQSCGRCYLPGPSVGRTSVCWSNGFSKPSFFIISQVPKFMFIDTTRTSALNEGAYEGRDQCPRRFQQVYLSLRRSRLRYQNIATKQLLCGQDISRDV